jgi:bifunctional non-homologous end joining protein LigD
MAMTGVSSFPAVVAALKALEVRSCLIDGEVVICDEQGLAVFDLLRRGDRVKQSAHLYAFDLLELDGRNLIRVSIEERKYELAGLLRHADAGLQICHHVDQPGDVVFAHACKLGYEGIVSKRLGSRYRSGRSPDWLKFKNREAPAVRREEALPFEE